MFLKALKLTGWRNYTGEKVSFSPGINLLSGLNGQGKTNILEAIFFLTCGQSPRTGKIEELINWNAEYFFLTGEFWAESNGTLIEMGGSRAGKRLSKINGIPVNRLAEISQIVNAVFFMPEDLYLVKGSPVRRRSFLDFQICQLSSSYRYNLANYKKYLRERNALLKSKVQDKIVLEILTQKLAELSGPITRMREEFLQKLSILARLNHRKLAGNTDELSLKYEWSVKPGLPAQEALQTFKAAAEMDYRFRATTTGPHKDDFQFVLNGSNLRVFGSQGQQRTAVLSLKLAEIELIKAETGKYPLLLLDDVFSELDEQRKKMLLDFLSGKVQTFISSAEPLPSQASAREYWIEEGKVCERK